MIYVSLLLRAAFLPQLPLAELSTSAVYVSNTTSLGMMDHERGWRNYCIVLFLIWNYGKHLSTNANQIQSMKIDFHIIWPCLISLLDQMNYRDFALIYFCLCIKYCVLVHLLCSGHLLSKATSDLYQETPPKRRMSKAVTGDSVALQSWSWNIGCPGHGFALKYELLE